MMRLPEAQRCPALLKAESTTHRRRWPDPRRRTHQGFCRLIQRHLGQPLPRDHRNLPPHLGGAGEADHLNVGICDQGGARFFPEALDDIEDPGGRPASWAILPKIQAVAGVSSAAFRTAALPQIRAGKTFQATLAIGVLAAMIRPATPTGCRTVMAYLWGTPLVVVRP